MRCRWAMKGAGPCSCLPGTLYWGSWDPEPMVPTPGSPFCWSCSTDYLALIFFGCTADGERAARSPSALMITLDGEILCKGRFPSAPWTDPWKETLHKMLYGSRAHFFFPCKLYLTFQRTLLRLVLGFMKKSVFNFKPW